MIKLKFRSGTSIIDFMDENKKQFGGESNLKYLFKVLSISQPLSIQIHPDKAWAKVLHKAKPDIYKDDNHKPEIAIALTPFKALCGFRSLKDINENLSAISLANPNAQEYLGLLVLKSEMDLKAVFIKLMELEAEKVKALVSSLLAAENFPYKEILTQLHEFFPYDRGCLCLYFLNYIEMKPGEAIFLEALTPHAYIEGDCIECMALSDNVVRAGLTPKLIDVKTLQEITNYKFSTEVDYRVVPKCVTEFNKVYLPPSIDEFSVQCLKLTRSHSEALAHDKYTRILLVVEGDIEIKHLDNQKELSCGAVVLLYPQNDYTIASNDQNSLVFIAY